MKPDAKTPKTQPSKKRVYAGIQPEKRAEARGKKLMAAGFNLFGTIGFQDTKIDQLCADANVGIRSFYELFETRERLFKEVYDDIAQEAYAALERKLKSIVELTPSKLLHEGISVYLHEMLDDTRRGRILSIESSRVDYFLGDHRNKTLKKFAQLSASFLPDSRNKEWDTHTWSLIVTGGINELIIDALVSSERVDVETLAKKASRVLELTLIPND